MWSMQTVEYYSARKKEGRSDTGDLVDGSGGHEVQRHKKVRKGEILYDSTCRKSLETTNS